MNLKIQVTDRQIKAGTRDCAKCPVARAINWAAFKAGQYRLQSHVAPTGLVILYFKMEEPKPETMGIYPNYEGRLPEGVLDWIEEFDRRLPVEPIEFSMSFTYIGRPRT